jgi:hypothetical protein
LLPRLIKENVMSDSPGFALPMPERFAEIPARAVDSNAVHYYWFGRRLWLTGLGRCVQALLLLVAGIFLLTQITSTPNLVVQIALTGGLMTLGGIALLYRALGDFFGGLKVDFKNVRVRTGWKSCSFPWSRVDRWSVIDHKPRLAMMPGIAFWLTDRKEPITIAAGDLDEQSRRDIHELFRTIAYGKETA